MSAIKCTKKCPGYFLPEKPLGEKIYFPLSSFKRFDLFSKTQLINAQDVNAITNLGILYKFPKGYFLRISGVTSVERLERLSLPCIIDFKF